MKFSTIIWEVEKNIWKILLLTMTMTLLNISNAFTQFNTFTFECLSSTHLYNFKILAETYWNNVAVILFPLILDHLLSYLIQALYFNIIIKCKVKALNWALGVYIGCDWHIFAVSSLKFARKERQKRVDMQGLIFIV